MSDQHKTVKTESSDDKTKDIVSKSQRKRDMQQLQELGRQLTRLTPDQLKSIAMPENLLVALLDYQSIASREASRRQLQYIGKLMKTADYDDIKQALSRHQQGSVFLANLHHQTEDHRSELLQGDALAITDFVSKFPHCNIQLLRQLVRHAHKDIELQKNRGNSKKLYRFLRDVIIAHQD